MKHGHPFFSPERFLAALVLLPACTIVAAAELVVVIANPLQDIWPGELVAFDRPAGELPDGPLSVEVLGVSRPVQREIITTEDVPKERLWAFLSIQPNDSEGIRHNIASVPARFYRNEADPLIQVEKKEDHFLIDNGIYQFRLTRYSGELSAPRPLSDIEHWSGGMRTLNQKAWDGKGRFDSNEKVRAVHVEKIRGGPVFADFRIVYEFVENNSGGEEVEALPLASGKQTFRWEPNRMPKEKVARRDRHYEVLMRFVGLDPWIDINERYHLPRDDKNEPWGISQYWLEWGKQGMPVDTVTWVRWFEYDRFGGNVDQNYVPARPRDSQHGRPFALLRPRWHQGGGGAQDFVLTSGGPNPGREEKPEQENWNPANPAAGIVAAFPSKWVGPGPATIATYAHDGTHGNARFPIIDGGNSGMHYGQRAYGLLVGERQRFNSLNSVVRRHTDWTLNALINKYVLEWERDPSLAGPNIYISREEYDRIKDDLEAGKDTHASRIVRASTQLLEELEAERKQLQARQENLRTEMEGSDGGERDLLRLQEHDVDTRIRQLEQDINSPDMDLIRLLTRGERKNVGMPGAGLWRQRRYQDDFLNPTSSPTRRITNIAVADLFSDGEPIGGADQAALGYIAVDLDAWPGYHNGWRPGNPNFHTDKYMAALYIGGALRDHPHADEWLAFGLENFHEDVGKVLLPPDGVGAEAPGYAGYATNLQLDIARILANTGYGNPVVENPLFAASANWHRKLLTPDHVRLGFRHTAPIGDTHRWTSGLGSGFGKLANFYRDADPEQASVMMGTWLALERMGYTPSKSSPLRNELIDMDYRIKDIPLDKMDWSSEAFYGFGAVFRNHFGTDRETFLTFKAGEARGHYHNDENSYHYYANGTPISLDYNCSYTPRGDHAALHNSMTFGRTETLRHNQEDYLYPTMEQITATARVSHFISNGAGDLVVAQRRQNALSQAPIFPRDHEFNRTYPSREVEEIVHRRSLLLVKHPYHSVFTDYLVVRDDTVSKEPQQLNIHLLAREIQENGRLFTATGQWDMDMMVYLAHASNPKTELREWYYQDNAMNGPGLYQIREDESQKEWKARMKALMDNHGVEGLPLPDYQPTYQNPQENRQWIDHIRATGGRALMPPPFWNAEWKYGEVQLWLKIETDPGTPILWVLYPYERGTNQPEIETIENGQGCPSDTSWSV